MISSYTIEGVPGHVAAHATLTLTDVSGEPRDDITVALQEKFDPDNPEPVRLEAVDLDPLSGTLVGANVEATTSSDWAALAGTGEQPHVGRWRVYAQIEAEANPTNGAIDTLVRLSYRSGDGPLGLTDRPVVTPHRAGALIEVDLGLVNIREAEGTHSWSGRVEFKGAIAGLDFKLRELRFLPATNWARMRAPQQTAAITGVVAHDPLDDVSGALDGEAAPAGGNWARVAGDTDDFIGAAGYVERSAASDTAIGTSTWPGVLARLGTGTAALTDVRTEFQLPGFAAADSTVWAGIFARYVDANNWLLAFRTNEHFSNGTKWVRLFLWKCIAGTIESLDAPGGRVVPFNGGWIAFGLTAFVNGSVVVFSGTPGSELPWVAGAAEDPDLATGGALDDGGWGIGGGITGAQAAAVLRHRNFLVAEGEDADHVIHPSQSLRLTHDKAERENAAGTRWGRVPHFEGARLKIPPSTRNSHVHRLVVKQDRNDLTQLPVGTTPPAELCTNPSAETDTTGWTNAGALTFERVTSLPTLDGLPAGVTTGFHVVGNSDGDRAFDEIAVTSGLTYRFAVYAYLDSSTATGVRLEIADAGGGSEGNSATLSALDTWTRLNMTVLADATETWQFRVRQIGAGATDFYFTAVSIRQLLLTPALTVTPRVFLTSG